MDDYEIDPATTSVLHFYFNSPQPVPIVHFTLPKDGVVEDDETFAMELVDTSQADQSRLSVRGGFFIETVQCTIVDSDGERNTAFSNNSSIT